MNKQWYVKDTLTIVYGGLIAVALAYFILSRPSFPQRYEYTWSYLTIAYLFAFYMGISIVSGWRLLDKLTANTFLFLPIIGWVIYFFIKLALALFIGGSCFYGIFRVGRNLYKIYELQSNMNQEME